MTQVGSEGKKILSLENLSDKFPGITLPCPYVLTVGCDKGQDCPLSHDKELILSVFQLQQCKNGTQKKNQTCAWYVYPSKKYLSECLLQYVMKQNEIEDKEFSAACQELGISGHFEKKKPFQRVVYCYHCIQTHGGMSQIKTEKKDDLEFQLVKSTEQKQKEKRSKGNAPLKSKSKPNSAVAQIENTTNSQVCVFFGYSENSCRNGESCRFQHDINKIKKVFNLKRCKTFRCEYLCPSSINTDYCSECYSSFEKVYLESVYQGVRAQNLNPTSNPEILSNSTNKEDIQQAQSNLAKLLFSRYSQHNLCDIQAPRAKSENKPSSSSSSYLDIVQFNAQLVSTKCKQCGKSVMGHPNILSKILFCSDLCHKKFIDIQKDRRENEFVQGKEKAKQILEVISPPTSL